MTKTKDATWFWLSLSGGIALLALGCWAAGRARWDGQSIFNAVMIEVFYALLLATLRQAPSSRSSGNKVILYSMYLVMGAAAVSLVTSIYEMLKLSLFSG
ncbi:phosphatidylglycerophosphate synthase [Granulicella aggregans]|uniref:Phosphatidylglycerophosphate synthase n=1 Tax=Granulicella aggregans TaxID=474949 RepID=A0A7W7ZKV1_9BACT|nr:hypothetical protein [Granulicella aggregans]MBB5061061.1 phosphatidylglycerophosphate synthase [Granulicella aggregans]